MTLRRWAFSEEWDLPPSIGWDSKWKDDRAKNCITFLWVRFQVRKNSPNCWSNFWSKFIQFYHILYYLIQFLKFDPIFKFWTVHCAPVFKMLGIWSTMSERKKVLYNVFITTESMVLGESSAEPPGNHPAGCGLWRLDQSCDTDA